MYPSYKVRDGIDSVHIMGTKNKRHSTVTNMNYETENCATEHFPKLNGHNSNVCCNNYTNDFDSIQMSCDKKKRLIVHSQSTNRGYSTANVYCTSQHSFPCPHKVIYCDAATIQIQQIQNLVSF